MRWNAAERDTLATVPARDGGMLGSRAAERCAMPALPGLLTRGSRPVIPVSRVGFFLVALVLRGGATE
jgi:hypothetical protein